MNGIVNPHKPTSTYLSCLLASPILVDLVLLDDLNFCKQKRNEKARLPKRITVAAL